MADFMRNGRLAAQKAGNALLEALYGACLDMQSAGTLPERQYFRSWATSFELGWSEKHKLDPFNTGHPAAERWSETTRGVIKLVERMLYEPILITGSPEALERRRRELEEVSDGW